MGFVMGGLLTMRPRNSLLAVVRTGQDPGGCGCTSDKDVVETMAAIGMPHAARMHAKGLTYPWTDSDLFLHFQEEDRRLFPLLLIVARGMPGQSRVSLEQDVAALIAEHQIFYRALRDGQRPDEEALKIHGKREDMLIRRYRLKLLHAAGRNFRGEPVQVGARSTQGARVGTDFISFDRMPISTGLSNSGVTAISPDVGAEKFMDPFFLCFGPNIGPEAVADPYLPPAGSYVVAPYEIYPNRFGVPKDVGLGYLNVPNRAADRVAAMRARMGATPPAAVSFDKSKSVGAIADASFKQIQRLSSSIQSAYADAQAYGNIAATFHLPIAEVQAQAAGVVDASHKTLQAEFIERTAKYRPVASVLGAAVAFAARGGDVSTSEAVGFVGAALASTVGSMVPILGEIIKTETAGIQNWLEAKKKTEEDARNTWYHQLQAVAQDTSAEQFPIPLHALDDLTVDFGSGGKSEADRSEIVRQAYEDNLRMFRSLTAHDAKQVQQWWTLASTLASHPAVLHAMNRLGHGSAVMGFSPTTPGINYTGLYSGQLASDEQVMLVAIPIAIANGLDPDTFARALWNRSKGWRDADPLSFQTLADGFHHFGGMDAPDLVTCRDMVTNAWWLQWAVLARDAMKLAAEMNEASGKYAPTPPDIFGFSGTPAWWPTLLGAAGTAGFYVLTAPLWLTLLPAMLGVAGTAALMTKSAA